MVDFTEEQQEEVRKIVAAAQNRQAIFERAKSWFMSSLYNSEYLVKNGELPPEVHETGQAIYQQFMHDWTTPKTPSPEKKEGDEVSEP